MAKLYIEDRKTKVIWHTVGRQGQNSLKGDKAYGSHITTEPAQMTITSVE